MKRTQAADKDRLPAHAGVGQPVVSQAAAENQIRRRRAKMSADTREAIVAAAAEIFGERGYNASSIEDVAEEAGVTKATIYYHFASKEDLYVSVRAGLLERSTEQVRESVKQFTTPVSALDHLIEETISMTLDRHRRYMFYHEIIPIRPEMHRVIATAQREYAVVLEEAVAAGQADGLFIDGPPRLVVSVLLGSIARTTWYRESGAVKPRQFMALLKTMVLGGVLTETGRAAATERRSRKPARAGA